MFRNVSSFPSSLNQVRRGQRAIVDGFAPDFPPARQAHLMAYGLTPDTQVRVLQHTPITIVQVDHLEIAIEHALAKGILVRAVRQN